MYSRVSFGLFLIWNLVLMISVMLCVFVVC